MKVTIKNLHNETFTVECDPNDSVLQLKRNIAEKKDISQTYDAELVKLLYTGKVMDDEDTVNSYSIKEDGFLVLIRQLPGKPKPPPKKKPNQGFNNFMGGFGANSMMQSPFQNNAFGNQPFQSGSLGQHAFQPNQFGQGSLGQGSLGQGAFDQGAFGQGAFGQGSLGQTTLQPNQFGSQSHAAAAAVPSGLEGTSPDSFSTAEDREVALSTLISMGFTKNQAETSLRKTFYNVEAAIEYITSNNIPRTEEASAIPTGIQAPTSPSAGNILGHHTAPSAMGNQASGGGMGTNINEMRQLLEKDPQKLQVLKQSLKDKHPEIAQMIDDNPQAFLQLLSQAGGSAGSAFDPSAFGGSATGAGATGGGATGSGGSTSGQSAGSIKVTLSPQEQQIIDRLQDLGFERNRAIEAFLACDRNENYAANYLLNSLE